MEPFNIAIAKVPRLCRCVATFQIPLLKLSRSKDAVASLKLSRYIGLYTE